MSDEIREIIATTGETSDVMAGRIIAAIRARTEGGESDA